MILSYGRLVNIDLHKTSVLFIYNTLRFDNVSFFWLNWEDDAVKVRNLTNNTKNVDFEAIVNNDHRKISDLLVYNMMRFEKVDFDWPTLWHHINLVCKIHKTRMHGGVSRFFESLMSIYYMKQRMKNVGQNAWWFHWQSPLFVFKMVLIKCKDNTAQ